MKWDWSIVYIYNLCNVCNVCKLFTRNVGLDERTTIITQLCQELRTDRINSKTHSYYDKQYLGISRVAYRHDTSTISIPIRCDIAIHTGELEVPTSITTSTAAGILWQYTGTSDVQMWFRPTSCLPCWALYSWYSGVRCFCAFGSSASILVLVRQMCRPDFDQIIGCPVGLYLCARSVYTADSIVPGIQFLVYTSSLLLWIYWHKPTKKKMLYIPYVLYIFLYMGNGKGSS